MITGISFFSRIKTNALQKICKYKNQLKFNMPKLKELKQDILELKEGMPEVLTDCPPIYKGVYHHEVKDPRFLYFNMEYRAYNFEGYDTKFPSSFVCIDSKGERRLKPHVYIKMVEIRPEYARQGVFTRTMKKLANMIKEDEECEGRIILDARKIESPEMTKIPSPSLAHWKCGFRFVNKEDNKIMERVLKNELPLEEAPEGTMYYSRA